MAGESSSRVLTAAFSGYRPEKMPFSENIHDERYVRFRASEARVLRMLVDQGYTRFVTGLAMGFDTWMAEDVLTLKEEFPALTLHCAIPFPEQDKAWREADCTRRRAILARADEVVTVSPFYTRDCYHLRNRYMVDMADALVAAYNGCKGGTAYTVQYAILQNCHVVCIDPATACVKMYGKPFT